MEKTHHAKLQREKRYKIRKQGPGRVVWSVAHQYSNASLTRTSTRRPHHSLPVPPIDPSPEITPVLDLPRIRPSSCALLEAVRRIPPCPRGQLVLCSFRLQLCRSLTSLRRGIWGARRVDGREWTRVVGARRSKGVDVEGGRAGGQKQMERVAR